MVRVVRVALALAQVGALATLPACRRTEPATPPSAPALLSATQHPVEKAPPVNRVVIPNGTVWNAGEARVAVSFTIDGTYLDADGIERHGPKARLEVLSQGSDPNESPTHQQVGAGSVLHVGSKEYRVVEVIPGPGDQGAVVLQPTGAPPAADSCETIRAEIRGAIERATAHCTRDDECALYPGGPVDCGAAVDKASADRIGQLADRFFQAECPLAAHCAPRLARAACREFRCIELSGREF